MASQRESPKAKRFQAGNLLNHQEAKKKETNVAGAVMGPTAKTEY